MTRRAQGEKRIRRPGTFRVGRLMIVVVLLGVSYLGITFGPPYWRSWKVHSILKDESARTYSKRHQDQAWEETTFHTTKRIRARLRQLLGVADKDLWVNVKRVGDELKVTARWKAAAEYPLLGTKSILTFERTVTMSLK